MVVGLGLQFHYKKESIASVFLGMWRIFSKQLFSRKPVKDSFFTKEKNSLNWKFRTMLSRKILLYRQTFQYTFIVNYSLLNFLFVFIVNYSLLNFLFAFIVNHSLLNFLFVFVVVEILFIYFVDRLGK